MSEEGHDVPDGGQGPASDEGSIVVFLVDDQAMIGEAVRRALASESDIQFHYCGSANDACCGYHSAFGTCRCR